MYTVFVCIALCRGWLITVVVWWWSREIFWKVFWRSRLVGGWSDVVYFGVRGLLGELTAVEILCLIWFKYLYCLLSLNFLIVLSFYPTTIECLDCFSGFLKCQNAAILFLLLLLINLLVIVILGAAIFMKLWSH